MTLSDHIAHALAHGAAGPELYDLIRRARYGYQRRRKFRAERAKLRALLATVDDAFDMAREIRDLRASA